MRSKILYILFLFIIVFSTSNFAQSAGGSLTLAFPMGEFKENVDNVGWGFSGHFLFLPQTPRNPFSIGLNVGFINYGNESRREPFSSTIPDVTVDVDRTNNLVNFHVLIQAILPTGIMRPYVEGLFGGQYIFTETTIKSRGTEEVASSTNIDDFAWSYGGGAGFLIQLSSNEDPAEDVSGIFLDLKARYLLGTEAEYLKEGSVKINNGRVTYDVTKSKTDLLTVHAGVVVQFNSLFNR